MFLEASRFVSLLQSFEVSEPPSSLLKNVQNTHQLAGFFHFGSNFADLKTRHFLSFY